MNIINNKRFYISITIIAFIFGLIILQYKNGFVRGFLSDVLINIFLYSLIKIFLEIKPLKLSVFILMFSFFTEFMQYIKILNYIHLQDNLIVRVIFGATFDFYDLFAYFIGVIIIYSIDIKIIDQRK